MTEIQPVLIRTVPWGTGIAVVAQYDLEKGRDYTIQETLDGLTWIETGSTHPKGNGVAHWSMFLATDVLAPFARLVLP